MMYAIEMIFFIEPKEQTKQTHKNIFDYEQKTSQMNINEFIKEKGLIKYWLIIEIIVFN